MRKQEQCPKDECGNPWSRLIGNKYYCEACGETWQAIPKVEVDTTLTQKVLEVLEGKKSFTGFIVDHDFPEVARLIVECVKEVGE